MSSSVREELLMDENAKVERMKQTNVHLAPWILSELHLIVIEYVGCFDVSTFLCLFQGPSICCTNTKDIFDSDILIDQYEDGHFGIFGASFPDPRNGNDSKTRKFLWAQPIFTPLQTIVVKCSYVYTRWHDYDLENAKEDGTENDYNMKLGKAREISFNPSTLEFAHEYVLLQENQKENQSQDKDALTVWNIMKRFWDEHIPQCLCGYDSHFWVDMCHIIETCIDRVVVEIKFYMLC